MRGPAFPRLLLSTALLAGLSIAMLSAETVTLPVAASVTGSGGVPFVSDARVFNTSYTDVLTVTAVYRFNGTTQSFQLAPREAKAFDDICVSLFATPNSLGAVEFTSPAEQGTLVVSSQLRSPLSSGGFVGMFIPGLAPSGAGAVTVLTGLVNGDSRTNIGVYNPNNNAVNATIRLFDGPVLLGSTSVGLGPHGVTQVNNIYGVVGFGSLVRTNGHATVESSDPANPLFTYAAEADNKSGDLILVVGAKDVAAPPGFHPPTPTLSSSVPTLTPTPTPTHTPTPPSGTQTITINVKAWDFNPGGPVSQALVLKVGTTYRLVFHNVDSPQTTNPRHGFSGISDLGLPGNDNIELGKPDFVIPSFTPQAFQRNIYPFACTNNDCGGDPEQHAH
ncbi:MAG TPA: hypothetical protein VGQ32_11020, partial [Thermoanaerobaculia bacterium]|nr:hypothetical protein [Thermoanaerobaculia bacterium]